MAAGKYTKIPNDLLEAIYSGRFSGIQTAVILYIARKTAGWNKPRDNISVSLMAKQIGCTRRAAIKAIRELQEDSVIFVKPSGAGRLNEFWLMSPKKWRRTCEPEFTCEQKFTSDVNCSSQVGVNKNSHQGVNCGSHTKDNTKDTLKDNNKRKAAYGEYVDDEPITAEEIEEGGWGFE